MDLILQLASDPDCNYKISNTTNPRTDWCCHDCKDSLISCDDLLECKSGESALMIASSIKEQHTFGSVSFR